MLNRVRLLLVLLFVSMVGTCSIFWAYEHDVNPHIKSIGDTLWWWFVSSTTVGYGDISPVTTQGRIAGVFAIVIGVYFYTNFITITADSLHGLTNQKRLGTAPVKATDHVVICEYTAFADELIQGLNRYPELSRREIVILTDLVQVQPYPQHHFVRGCPSARSPCNRPTWPRPPTSLSLPTHASRIPTSRRCMLSPASRK